MDEIANAREVARAAAERTQELLGMLRPLDRSQLEAPSELPDWTRLTIVCHLRYGAGALLRMTRDALAGRETSYYPGGRSGQRPATLVPAAGEDPHDVLADWASTAAELDEEWSALGDGEWRTEVVEPADNQDLGRVPLARLALARLTEVDVHGTDLGIGAPDWSSTLVSVALPTRLAWLSSRRTNHRTFDSSISGSWLFEAAEGLRWLLSVDGDGVGSRPATDDDEAQAVISGSGRDLLALLLGRPRRTPLRFGGDVALAESFERAFPGP